MAARLPSWAWVTGLTVGATVAVVALAVQADHGPHPTAATVKPSTTASASTHGSAKPKPPAGPPALPAGSGDGRRIVYSLGAKRLWLVDASGKETRTFEVWPGTVTLPPGHYSIIKRTQSITGSDGVPIEHIMYVAMVDGVNVAFSNALDGSSPPPAQGKKLGGIRMRKQDGAALWAFGDQGTSVVVVK
ncbi:L,D-transpeptidase [Streptomyces sp. NEAU-sy36]|uniref:L,D-transpeptidase n=1 Tax=unclassified Streptomyces TaxID=2593676 RepID=UPI0015D5E8A5|nr:MULTISPECIES: L,D-transpeptidase [unclassified Streptomyces]QLI99875.1 L,D-transpeptidase [Streptomyces sp. NEAU-sy36]